MDAVSAGISLAPHALSIAITILVITRGRGKTEGVIQTEVAGLKNSIAAISTRMERVEEKIDEHTGQIGFLQGKANGKAREVSNGI